MNEKSGEKLLKSARCGDLKAVEQLLKELDSTPDKDLLNRTLQAAAFGGGNIEVVDRLLDAGANPNQTTSVGTLLMCAAMNGNLPLVKRLIEAGADFHRVVKRETALSSALSENQRPVIEYLEKLGAQSPPGTSLLYASIHVDTVRAQQAISDGAELEQPGGTFRETPLMAAARRGQLAAVNLLLQAGANPNKRVEARTALFDAVEYGKNVAVVQALVKAGADIHAKQYDETVLMAACKGGSLPVVKLLLELGSNLNARDKNFGKTALDCAKDSKNKELIALLSSHGATAERDDGRALIRALAKEFGGKFYEHTLGFTLNSKLAGNKCQIHAHPDKCSAGVFGVKYLATDFHGKTFPECIVCSGLADDPYKELQISHAASQKLGLRVYSTIKKKDAERGQSLASFCERLKAPIVAFSLAPKEYVSLSHDSIGFGWVGTDIPAVTERLSKFAALVRAITRAPQPERRIFETEWLIKPAPKTGDLKSAARHTLGGTLDKPVACPHCGAATNLMAHIDLSDPALPKTPLGVGRLPVFWCLECGEWDPGYFNIAGAAAKPFRPAGAKMSAKIEPGEEDLAEQRALLVPVTPGKKAGRKSKIGGAPTWLQGDSTPNCPKCEKSMAFVLQLASDRHISYCDMGMLYSFACPDCKVSASMIQSH